MEIIICKNCEGKGEIDDGMYDRDIIECSKCLGTGKLYTQTFTLSSPLVKKTEFITKSTIIINLLNSK